MKITRAIKITESMISTNKTLIKDDEESDFSKFLIMQNRALETLLAYVKAGLN